MCIRHEWHFLKQSDQSRSSQKSGTSLCNGRTKEPPQDEGTALCPASALPAESLTLPPSIDAHRTLGAPSVHRCPPSPWLSLRESWREAPERAHCTDSTHKLPKESLHRFYLQSIHKTTAPIPYTKLHPITHCLHDPSPPPFGRYLSRRERQGLCSYFKLLHTTAFCLRVVRTR